MKVATLKTARAGSKLWLVPPFGRGYRGGRHLFRVVSVEDGVLHVAPVRSGSGSMFSIDRSGFFVSRR